MTTLVDMLQILVVAVLMVPKMMSMIVWVIFGDESSLGDAHVVDNIDADVGGDRGNLGDDHVDDGEWRSCWRR